MSVRDNPGGTLRAIPSTQSAGPGRRGGEAVKYQGEPGYVRLNVLIPEDMMEGIQATADYRNTTVSEVVREALTMFRSWVPPEPKPALPPPPPPEVQSASVAESVRGPEGVTVNGIGRRFIPYHGNYKEKNVPIGFQIPETLSYRILVIAGRLQISVSELCRGALKQFAYNPDPEKDYLCRLNKKKP
jgi:hypothetical protein